MRNMRFLHYVMLVLALSLVGCQSEEKELETDNKVSSLIYTVDTKITGNYDLAILNKKDSLLMLVDYDNESNMIKRIDNLYDSDLISYTFDENGRLESFSSYNNSIIICFGNYEDETFDVTMKDGEEILYFENIDVPETVEYKHPENRLTRAGDEKFDEIKYAGRVVKDLISSFVATCRGNMSVAGLKFLESHLHAFEPLFDSLGSTAGDIVDTSIFGAELGTFISSAAVAAETGSAISVLGASLAWLGAAYAAYEVGESLGEEIAELQIEIKNLIEHLKGMLSSGVGDLKVTLSWSFYADIDLHAYEPNGTHIYFENPFSLYTDGFLDKDNTEGGPGSVENIYWENPEEGAYHFYLDYYDGTQSGVCTATVTYKGQGRSYKVPMSEGSWVNFASQLVSSSAKSANKKEKRQVSMDIYLKPDKEKKSTMPIVVFRQ